MTTCAAPGQVAIESAFVMPLMVFLTLGVIQLTSLEHAKLMTEYAAYQASRAGIVWGGNNERMRDAAIVALLPTMGGRTDTVPHMALTWGKAHLLDSALRSLSWGSPVPQTVNGSDLSGLVRVDIINPAYFTPIDTLWNLPGGANWQELDFDGPEGFPEAPQLARHIAQFFDLNIPDNQQEVYRKATVLSIRLRYWYEMRIPFANWIIFLSWYGANAAGGLGNQKGYATTYAPEMGVLWGLASGSIPLDSNAGGKRYFMPLSATYSMRMQSNFNRKWLMHLNPSWGL